MTEAGIQSLKKLLVDSIVSFINFSNSQNWLECEIEHILRDEQIFESTF